MGGDEYGLKFPPMLARLAEVIPKTGYAYEVKWDGVRAVAYIEGKDKMTLVSRNNLDITGQYPEVSGLLRQLQALKAEPNR